MTHDLMATAATGGDAAPPAFQFQLQREFHTVPLGIGEDADAFDAQVRQFARDYWGEREELEPLRKLTKAMYAASAQNLVAGGVVHNALGIFPIGGTADGSEPPERISRATLTVSVRTVRNPDPHFTAAGIAESLDKAGDGSEVQLIALPAGPAVVRVAGSRAVWERPEDTPDGTGQPDGTGRPDAMGQPDPTGQPDGTGQLERYFVRIEVWVPFPGEDRLLLFCLSTSDVEDLFRYQAILADIADTLTFGEAEPPPAAEEAAPPAPSASPFASY
ncbi:hypothetical protein ACWD4G_22935 [Streptomyces sp. NPDC002643]